MKSMLILVLLLGGALSSCHKNTPSDPPTTPATDPKANPPVTAPKTTPLPVHANLIPRDLLFGNPKKSGLQISPDGKKLAFIAPVKGVLNVWVQTIGASDARAVTTDTYRGIRGYFWSPDSGSILYAQDKGGNEDFRIYQTDVVKLTTRLLTPETGVRTSIVAVNKRHADTILISMNKRNKQLFDVYRLSLKTGKLTLDTQNPGNVLGWVADWNMKVRAALSMNDKGEKGLMVRTSTKAKWKTIRTWSALDSGGPVTFSKDGKHLIVLGNKGSDMTRLYSINLKNNKITEIFTNPKADLSGVAINPDTYKIEAVSTEYIYKEWKALDPTFKKDLDNMRKLAGKLRFGIVNRSYDNMKWVVAVGGPGHPAKYYLYERKGGTFSLLVETRRELKKYRLSTKEPVVIKARDGLDVVCYLAKPALPLPGKQPMVLLVHGGPWHQDKYTYTPMVQWLANRGYVTLEVNFRGSTGFGKKFLNAGNKEWGRKMQHDLTDAVKWAIANANVDPKRVGIMGGSYGGYATLAGVTFTPDLYAVGVDIVGPSSIITLLKSVPPYWKPMMAIFKTRVGDLATEEKMLKERSPLYHADRIKTPLAIFQGANDPRVKIHESNQIVKAIRKNKGKVLYVVYPDEGHGFRREPNRMDYIARTEGFLAKYLGGRAQPHKAIKGSTAEIR
ncbi:S9 family peptidase [Myxococcota bacterium]|nr:S9 family peptidase [Myxococcota bacterium]